MPTWQGSVSGLWTDPTRWDIGPPSPSNPIATIPINTSTGVTISIPRGGNTTLTTMNIALTGSNGLTFAGVAGASGSAPVLEFNGGSGSFLNVTSTAFSAFVWFRSTNNLSMLLSSNLHISNSGPAPTILDLPISGGAAIIKSGNGTLSIVGSNSFSGGIELQDGILSASGGAALGTGTVFMTNGAELTSEGIIDNAFFIFNFSGGGSNSARISARPATTMTLTGLLNHESNGALIFDGTPTSTIIASFSSIIHNPTAASFEVDVGTLRFGTSNVASTLFAFPGSGTTSIRTNASLDTAGFASTIGNLRMSGGTILTSSGTLNVTVNGSYHSAATGNPQTGTIRGTSGNDRFIFNAQDNFGLGGNTIVNLNGLTFTTWTNGLDQIQINGRNDSVARDDILGTTRNDLILGFAGDDILRGGGGIDAISGGNGNDLIELSSGNSGSTIQGGFGIDTLRIQSGVTINSLGQLDGIEAMVLLGNAQLSLTSAQFTNGLTIDAVLSGLGTIYVNLSPGNQTVLARAMTVLAGSTISMSINGTTGTDVIKAAIGAFNGIIGDAGNDQLVGGGLGDAINGGDDIDKIRGDGGADFLTGGLGADVFKYRNASDSGIGANADTITDFLSGTDRLNFARIDTNPGLAGDQGFAYVGTAAFSGGGVASIRYTDLGADLRVEADVNGDGVADMHVLLTGAGAQTLNAADFVL